jgi:Fe2+ transport system protein B
MIVNKETRDLLLEIQKTKRLFLEGNLLKVIEAEEGDVEFSEYLKESTEKDKAARRRRLEVTKQVQEQNADLLDWQRENQHLTDNLKDALTNAESAKSDALSAKEEAERLKEEAVRLKDEAEQSKEEAEKAKDSALNDLDVLQKRSQTELISTIVKVALLVILSVGVITTIMYSIAMWTGKDTQIIGSTWSNMFGILLTNAFSIVGTIMGVKYASEGKENK